MLFENMGCEYKKYLGGPGVPRGYTSQSMI